jgi:hypothetical protein
MANKGTKLSAEHKRKIGNAVRKRYEEYQKLKEQNGQQNDKTNKWNYCPNCGKQLR